MLINKEGTQRQIGILELHVVGVGAAGWRPPFPIHSYI